MWDRHLGWLCKIPNINLSSEGTGTSINKNSKDRGEHISKCWELQDDISENSMTSAKTQYLNDLSGIVEIVPYKDKR